MIQSRKDLYSKDQTANRMYYLIDRFYNDLKNFKIRKGKKIVPLPSLTVREFFYFVRSIPYRQDKKPIEVVSRPYHILKYRNLGMDCKKKGILLGSFLRLKKVPFRLIGSSKRKSGRIHHVYPQVFVNGNWKNYDATYKHYRPFQIKEVTNYEVLNV